MKKIGIISFGDGYGGGVFQYTQSMIDALRSDTTNEYVIFCDLQNDMFDSYGLEVRKINKPISSLIVKIVRLFMLFFKIQSTIFINAEEKKIFSDIDLFLSPAISPYPHYFLNKPFIFTLHDMQERYYPKFFTLKELMIRWIINNAMAGSAREIICESNYVKNDIVRFTGAKAESIAVIQAPPPLEFVNFIFDNSYFEVIKNKYKLPEKYIFYPAQCWFHKNHIKLIEAFNIVSGQIDDVYLVLTGSQQNNYINLLKRVEELGLKDKVKHLGYIDYEDLSYLYKMSQMLVMPTLFESVSIPIYEAFALKVPVCSSNVVALPEQVGDAGLIFDPLDEVDIAEKIMMYLRDGSLAREKVEIGFEKIANFSHQEYRKKLLEVLNKEG